MVFKFYNMVIVDFIRFLANPNAEKIHIETKNKFVDFAILFVLALLISYGLLIVLQAFINPPANQINDLSFAKLLLFALFLGPLFEELVFRLSLIYSKLNLSISLGLANAALITTLLDIRLLTLFGGFTFFIGLCSSYIFLNKHQTAYSGIEKFWKNHFALIFYISSIAFGLIHFTNYDLNSISALLIAILFSVPQMFGGLILGFVRIRLGFLPAVLMHILFNSVPFVLMWIYQ
jgi:uncharacterized protein